jgi:2-polyprenyl-3-methyl-5-hydroxy-6-metoxy-1,4-benzoquinol methylase
VSLLARLGAHFDARAARYDQPLTAWIGEHELRAIRPLVPAGSAVLDYGCGTGRTTLDLLRRGCAVTAFDVSRRMLERAEAKAQRNGLTAEFACRAEQLAGGRWPFVTCIGVLDYYADPVPLLGLLRRHLLPGGRLVVTLPNRLSPLGQAYALLARLRFPVIPRSPRFARWAAAQAGLEVASLAYAFPAVEPVGMTLVLCLSSRDDGEPNAPGSTSS